jgi:RNA-directed DNA polymerase
MNFEWDEVKAATNWAKHGVLFEVAATVHHALCAVIAPIFERGFIADSYANRKGYGTHRAVARFEHYRERHRDVLRADIYRHFPAIDHEILKAEFRRRTACERTLWLMDAIVDGANRQEPVHRYFPGDDLFAPFERRRGLPTGTGAGGFWLYRSAGELCQFQIDMM